MRPGSRRGGGKAENLEGSCGLSRKWREEGAALEKESRFWADKRAYKACVQDMQHMHGPQHGPFAHGAVLD